MPNSVIEVKFNFIVNSVCYWLGYQYIIGRDQLIHEASLRYPIADTITAKGVSINRVVLEQLHPLFKSKKIDLVIFDETVEVPADEEDDTKIKEVFEFKLANSKTAKFESDEHQRVFDDVTRLAYYNMWGKKDCYFLMCGKYEEFQAYFVGHKESVVIDINGRNKVVERKNLSKNINDGKSDLNIELWISDGIYEKWFSFHSGESKTITFEKDNSNDKNDWGLKSFQDRYQLRDEKKSEFSFSDNIVIKTTCIAITPAGEKNRTHAAGIWKIEANE